jgi:hypothetical protein
VFYGEVILTIVCNVVICCVCFWRKWECAKYIDCAKYFVLSVVSCEVTWFTTVVVVSFLLIFGVILLVVAWSVIFLQLVELFLVDSIEVYQFRALSLVDFLVSWFGREPAFSLI